MITNNGLEFRHEIFHIIQYFLVSLSALYNFTIFNKSEATDVLA